MSIMRNLFLVSSETAERLLEDPATIYQTLDSLDESDADLTHPMISSANIRATWNYSKITFDAQPDRTRHY